MYVYALVSHCHLVEVRSVTPSSHDGVSYVYFAILESLLQVVVDCLVGNLTDQSKIRNPDFLLLGCIESRFLDVRFTASSPGSTTTTALGIRGLVALGPSTDSLCEV